MASDVLYTSDLHGSRHHYEETLRLAREEEVRAIVLGGDLAPPADPAGQRAFFREFLIPLLRGYAAEPRAAAIYYIFGNGDWRANEAVLEESGLPNVRYVHGRALPFLDGAFIAGLAYVPPTPIRLKDWERWEHDERSPSARPDGVRSGVDGAVVPFTFAGREEEESLEGELEALGAAIDAALRSHAAGPEARMVLVFHGPPRGTACDQIAGGTHVGSAGARRFLLRRRPALSLHGHIHESPSISGKYLDLLGETLCVNPGQHMDALHGVLFRLDDIRGTIRHTLLGRPVPTSVSGTSTGA